MFGRVPTGAWLRSSRSALGRALGHLEQEVMEIVWSAEALTVRNVQARLGRPTAYTTVMTTMDRLFRKGFVERRLDGRAYVYRAAHARAELEARVTSGLLADVLDASPGAARPFLSNLVDVVAERDDRLLDALEQLVREKRARMKRERT
ncbi:MAG TPA: BlaI/MecI/CopY family transcriptional regulator [Vicinamibacterales bacterium]|nr:BlaI/MecI/CopY family transcriptional regulator [Vicinamibacterales bacterium]